MIYFNLILELLSLWSIWPTRLVWIRLLLIYNILFDEISISVKFDSATYWYFYWIGHTVVFFFLLILSIIEIPTPVGSIFQTLRKTVSWSCCGLLLALITKSWLGELTASRMLELNTAESIIVCMMSLLAIFNRRLLIVSLGSLLFGIVTLLCGINTTLFNYYPMACTAPLILWSSYRFVRRRLDGYDTPTRNVQGFGREGGDSRKGIRHLHKAVRA